MKLTPEQKRTIRDVAKDLAGRGNVTLEVGHRYSKICDWEGFNLDAEPDPEETDLFTTEDWSTFVKTDLPADCTLDFYVYSTGYNGQLETNLIVRIREGELFEMFQHGPGGQPIWRATK